MKVGSGVEHVLLDGALVDGRAVAVELLVELVAFARLALFDLGQAFVVLARQLTYLLIGHRFARLLLLLLLLATHHCLGDTRRRSDCASRVP